jgi:hypothetical protein
MSIEHLLNDLAFQRNDLRLKAEFREYPATGQAEYTTMNRELSCAYWEWRTNKDASAALTHLANVKQICEERLSPEYLNEYNSSVAQLRLHISPHSQSVHRNMDLRNLLSRMQSL